MALEVAEKFAAKHLHIGLPPLAPTSQRTAGRRGLDSRDQTRWVRTGGADYVTRRNVAAEIAEDF